MIYVNVIGRTKKQQTEAVGTGSLWGDIPGIDTFPYPIWKYHLRQCMILFRRKLDAFINYLKEG